MCKKQISSFNEFCLDKVDTGATIKSMKYLRGRQVQIIEHVKRASLEFAQVSSMGLLICGAQIVRVHSHCCVRLLLELQCFQKLSLKTQLITLIFFYIVCGVGIAKLFCSFSHAIVKHLHTFVYAYRVSYNKYFYCMYNLLIMISKVRNLVLILYLFVHFHNTLTSTFNN